jgi:hypothetical protein
MFMMKYGAENVKDQFSVRKGSCYFRGIRVGRLLRKDCVTITQAKRSLFGTTIRGTIRCPEIADSISVKALCGEAEYDADISGVPAETRLSFINEPISSIYDFTIKIPASRCRDPHELTWSAIAGGSKIDIDPVFQF